MVDARRCRDGLLVHPSPSTMGSADGRTSSRDSSSPSSPSRSASRIMKYHLYDVDLVLRKTLMFGVLAVFITRSTSRSSSGSVRPLRRPGPVRGSRRRSWRWRSSPSDAGVNASPTASSTGSEPRRTRSFPSSRADWVRRTPPKTILPRIGARGRRRDRRGSLDVSVDRATALTLSLVAGQRARRDLRDRGRRSRPKTPTRSPNDIRASDSVRSP